MRTVGSLVYFEHHLKAEKGLASTSIRSYRDGIRLFLLFLARENRRPISKLTLRDLSADNVRAFLAHLEAERGNGIRARNHRPAMLHTFFAYVGGQEPMVLPEPNASSPSRGSARSRQPPIILNAMRSSGSSTNSRAMGSWPSATRRCSCSCTIRAPAQRKSSD
ncbi:hypothetical protein MPL3365_170098 [Mesorhizobium plurifarium]|uniref:Core-binding (CB) domain-containing protein n=1 Tax=Mesorhizobium plurifarium TaxID=69974 RepID=A0A090FYV0_MESPL|nr:hypothetical protein MPL3365_170098 [Mesorhizobium plurifarium]